MLIFAIRCTVVITSPNKNSSANTIFTNFRQFILHADPPIGLFLASAVAESVTGEESGACFDNNVFILKSLFAFGVLSGRFLGCFHSS